MAPGDVALILPGHGGRLRRSTLFLILGALSFLTLCLFAAHLPALQRLTSMGPIGSMTSLGVEPAPLPHHDHPDGQARQAPEREERIVEFYKVLLDHVDSQQGPSKMAYGTNKHPPFRDDPPLLIRDLPAEYIPSYTPPSPLGGPGGPGRGDGSSKTGKRLLVVGDVHGHLDALKALLRKVGFDNKQGDHLVMVGDLVTKGPDSKGVVKFAMELGASAVRGNQEDKVLAAAREIHRLSLEDKPDTEDHGEVETDFKKDHARKIARSLSRAQLDWLRSLPIILRISNIPAATSAPWNATTLAIVHGGLVPGLPLEKQDPWAVMNMRSLVYPGRKKSSDDDPLDSSSSTPTPNAVAVPISGHEGEPWSRAWSRHQNHLPPSAPHTLAIYGHDARSGLQVSPKVDISPHHPSSSLSSSSPSSSPYSTTEGGEEGEDEEEDEGGEEEEEEEEEQEHDLINNDNTNKKKKKNKKKKRRKETGLRYAFGLDSGCGHAKKLSGLVIEATADGVRGWVEQVECS